MTRGSLGAGGKLVWDVLSLFAERRYAEANAFLAPGCRMLFRAAWSIPIARICRSARRRSNRWVKKEFERIDEFEAADGTVVYNSGALRGEWPDGTPFEGASASRPQRAGRSPDRQNGRGARTGAPAHDRRRCAQAVSRR